MAEEKEEKKEIKSVKQTGYHSDKIGNPELREKIINDNQTRFSSIDKLTGKRYSFPVAGTIGTQAELDQKNKRFMVGFRYDNGDQTKIIKSNITEDEAEKLLESEIPKWNHGEGCLFKRIYKG